jgi:hypothetical protein
VYVYACVNCLVYLLWEGMTLQWCTEKSKNKPGICSTAIENNCNNASTTSWSWNHNDSTHHHKTGAPSTSQGNLNSVDTQLLDSYMKWTLCITKKQVHLAQAKAAWTTVALLSSYITIFSLRTTVLTSQYLVYAQQKTGAPSTSQGSLNNSWYAPPWCLQRSLPCVG